MNDTRDEEWYGIQGGFLVVLEGIDSVGKSTQAQLLANRLKKEHFRVKIFSEPTKGKWGQKIRNLV
ncbi:MAG: dTMP kinase, partial [Candidatus Hodarchaeota archaeon]